MDHKDIYEEILTIEEKTELELYRQTFKNIRFIEDTYTKLGMIPHYSLYTAILEDLKQRLSSI